MLLLKKSMLLFSVLAVNACSTPHPAGQTPPAPAIIQSEEAGTIRHIRLASWNAEHLSYPADFGCKPRNSESIQAMQAYAENLDADIIALQEVASIEALAQIFSPQQWQLVMSERPDSQTYECRENGLTSTQQKVAFAVRNTVQIKDTQQLKALALDNPGLRYGLALTVESPFGDMALLNVHMKSGCFTDDYTRQDSSACQTYAQQAPVLDKWIAEQEQSGQHYAVLGDFNHRISAPYNRLTRLLTRDKRNLTIATRDLLGCHPRYPAPIDHILIGGINPASAITEARFHAYADMQPEAMISDHCAVSVNLIAEPVRLSSAVRWQTTSKEYQALTESVYQQATEAIPQAPSADWVVVMDVDETILDNSPYQIEAEQSGRGYTPESWAAWVAREKAGLVPGAKAFMQQVYAAGGKIVLITNRERAQDVHTWRNLIAVDVPVTSANTCLMGRTGDDKQAVNGVDFINDKDWRREQIRRGTATCFTPHGSIAESWSEPQLILMQVGDNIEDFAGVTQEEAKIDQLLPDLGKQLFLLPNPMYGSW